ncbi:hypothetical protein EAO71_03560 [Streptomyces sp. ms191]|nr:hypothetical protein EAO71_03560 [Streptomyces sp. ms191]
MRRVRTSSSPAAACTYPAGGGLITVDPEPGGTSAKVALEGEGVRSMEAAEEGWSRARPGPRTAS